MRIRASLFWLPGRERTDSCGGIIRITTGGVGLPKCAHFIASYEQEVAIAASR